ncbi:putative TrmH family tRNA/rRNA methyltransferase YacO [Symbiodinium microadriaticum]|uniref:Putative TrmH family tRNA/rRNA methyltransferase YacO n=1 Tax=Symbiodinium microadriaticum TaxID=2951 RepID=A0A1Q9EXG3_SYMMI|nr:putative TrmH family tRNA/rRNA methyltransferase YacO [Symbiodinium microadriaticum]
MLSSCWPHSRSSRRPVPLCPRWVLICFFRAPFEQPLEREFWSPCKDCELRAEEAGGGRACIVQDLLERRELGARHGSSNVGRSEECGGKRTLQSHASPGDNLLAGQAAPLVSSVLLHRPSTLSASFCRRDLIRDLAVTLVPSTRGSACQSRSPQPDAAAASYMMHVVTILQLARAPACCARVAAASSERLRGSCNAYILVRDLDRRIEVTANGLLLCNPGVAVDGALRAQRSHLFALFFSALLAFAAVSLWRRGYQVRMPPDHLALGMVCLIAERAHRIARKTQEAKAFLRVDDVHDTRLALYRSQATRDWDTYQKQLRSLASADRDETPGSSRAACIPNLLAMAGPGFFVSLTFDAASKRPPMQFELAPGVKESISIGRAPKSDVVCTLSGISWNHLEMKLPNPIPGGPFHVVVRDLSMNGSGVRLPGEEQSLKLTKDTDMDVASGATVSFPMRKPKAKGEEREVIQQSFAMTIESLADGKRLPKQNLAEGQKRPLQQVDEASAKRRATGQGQLPESCTQRLAKGEALVKSARQAESRGRLVDAFHAYSKGIQHIIRVLPSLEKDSPLLLPAKNMVKDNLERAAMVKQRQSRLKLAEAPAAPSKPRLKRLPAMAAVHYNQVCLEQLALPGAATAAAAVASIALQQGASAQMQMLAAKVADAATCPVYELPAALLEEFCMDLSWGEPVRYAIAWPRSKELQDMKPPFLVLDGLVSAWNLGQAVRSAVMLGVKSVVLSRSSFNCLNGRACHASCGWLYHAEYHLAEPLTDALESLRDLGICQCLGLFVAWPEGRLMAIFFLLKWEDHPQTVGPHSLDGDARWALVVGNEEKGISPDILARCSSKLRVPQVRGASLNVGHASAICLYELGRHLPRKAQTIRRGDPENFVSERSSAVIPVAESLGGGNVSCIKTRAVMNVGANHSFVLVVVVTSVVRTDGSTHEKRTNQDERLSHAAFVEEIEHANGRLRYKLITGSGPETGWAIALVSTRLYGKAEQAGAQDAFGVKMVDGTVDGSFVPFVGRIPMAAARIMLLALAGLHKDQRLVLARMTGEGREPWATYIDLLVGEINKAAGAECGLRQSQASECFSSIGDWILFGHSRGAAPATCVAYRLGTRVKKVYIVACGAMKAQEPTGWELLSQRFKEGGDRDLLKWFSSIQPDNLLLRRTAFEASLREFEEQYRDAMFPDPDRDFGCMRKAGHQINVTMRNLLPKNAREEIPIPNDVRADSMAGSNKQRVQLGAEAVHVPVPIDEDEDADGLLGLSPTNKRSDEKSLDDHRLTTGMETVSLVGQTTLGGTLFCRCSAESAHQGRGEALVLLFKDTRDHEVPFALDFDNYMEQQVRELQHSKGKCELFEKISKVAGQMALGFEADDIFGKGALGEKLAPLRHMASGVPLFSLEGSKATPHFALSFLSTRLDCQGKREATEEATVTKTMTTAVRSSFDITATVDMATSECFPRPGTDLILDAAPSPHFTCLQLAEPETLPTDLSATVSTVAMSLGAMGSSNAKFADIENGPYSPLRNKTLADAWAEHTWSNGKPGVPGGILDMSGTLGNLPFPDASTTLFPMYTLPMEALLRMTKICSHEELKEKGALVLFERSMGKAAFISHQWVAASHPDPEFRQMSVLQDCEEGSKIQGFTRGMPSSGLNSEPLFFWYDYFSCPQLEKSESFHKAVDSIPAYVARCAFFFVLAPVIENTDLGAVFTEVSWAQRGWCLVERLCRELSEEAPLIVIKSQTQITVVSSVMHYGSMARSPGECDFTLESDKIKLGPVLQKALHGKLLMLLRARDLGGYRVLLNLQPVLLRGFKVLPKYCLFQDEGAEPSSLDPASHAVAEFLFQNGFETISDIDGSGWSPLHYAALRGEPLLIQGLLEQRADPSCKTRKANPNHGTTVAGVEALDLCLAHRNNEAGRVLMQAKASPHSRWGLASACMGDNAEGVRMLCEAGCSPLARDRFGNSMISIACMFGSLAAFEELACRTEALDPLTLSRALDDSLILRGHAALAQRLIALRADVNTQRQAVSPLSSGLGMVVGIMSLQHRLGRVTPLTVTCFHWEGRTPLMSAIMAGQHDGAAVLIAARAQLDLQTKRGWSAVDFARQQSLPAFLLQALLEGEREPCELVASLVDGSGGYVQEYF